MGCFSSKWFRLGSHDHFYSLVEYALCILMFKESVQGSILFK